MAAEVEKMFVLTPTWFGGRSVEVDVSDNFVVGVGNIGLVEFQLRFGIACGHPRNRFGHIDIGI